MIGKEGSNVLLDTLNSGFINKELNSTYIALIPKVKNLTRVTEFRPISLCNVLYKLISKTLANRLKIVLPKIISLNQSAFIPGQLIIDNILVAYETLHTMQARMWGKKGFIAIKLNMSKAYEMVEWESLKAVMKRLGFARRWIQLLVMCVKMTNYAIIINEVPMGNFEATRGLLQRNPISQYLFFLCAEALSAMFMRATSDGFLTGVPTSRRGPRINHIFFADDSLFFCKANQQHW